MAVQLDGRGVLSQDGREAVLEPGDFVAYDSSRPFSLGFDGAFRMLVLMCPRAAVTLSPAELAAVTSVRISGRDGVGALVSPFLSDLTGRLDAGVAGLHPAAEGRLSDAILDMLAASLLGAGTDTGWLSRTPARTRSWRRSGPTSRRTSAGPTEAVRTILTGEGFVSATTRFVYVGLDAPTHGNWPGRSPASGGPAPTCTTCRRRRRPTWSCRSQRNGSWGSGTSTPPPTASCRSSTRARRGRPAPPSARSRSHSPTGRASPSTTGISDGRAGICRSASTPGKDWCCTGSGSSTAAGSGRSSTGPTDEVRARLLGPGWDERGTVRIRWISITTLLTSFGGRVFLFDATVMDQLFRADDRTDHVSLAEVVAARPEAVFIDHVHPDQSRHAARVAVATGAVIVGAQEACDFVKRDAAVKSLDAGRVCCDLVRDAAGKPFTGTGTWISPVETPFVTPIGTTGKPALGGRGVDVSAVKLKHSQTRRTPAASSGRAATGPTCPLIRRARAHSPSSTSSRAGTTTAATCSGCCGTGITFVKHGSTGSLDPLVPGGAQITAALRALGAADRVDIEAGGIAELNNYVNGLVDARRYAGEIGAKVFLPIHHGNWAPPFTSEAAAYYEPWKAELGRIDSARRPDLCFLVEATRATVFGLRTGGRAGDARGHLEPIGGPGCHRG